ncbi:MAG: hypothetical protein ABS75_05280 [Pelagibacterium sp. SCN 63-23]|mgnify:CR=1 FL=1|nr:MAG: hypothetical protein ABS75_05280 [Pelagibacterium sp. SCN 63-23]
MLFTDFLPGLFRKAEPEPTTPAPVTLTDPLAAWIFGAQPTYSNISVTPYVRNGKGKEADPAHPAFRRCTVEHLFGTIKGWMGATHF